MNPLSFEVAILGAGLQGTGVALELARRGIAVALVEQDPHPMNRASLRNEGKIHLGFIYAKDRSLATAHLQLEGALRFRRILARWIDPNWNWLLTSQPFHYLVARDSVVPPDELAIHYAAIERRCRERLEQDSELDYLGARPERWVRPLSQSELAARFEPARFSAGFATGELAVDTMALAGGLRRAVAESPNLTFLRSHRVRSIAAEGGGFRLEGEALGEAWRLHADQVVNATWERRLALDQQLGISPPEHLLHRLKYRVIARLPQSLLGAPSVSMVLGRYGDVVIRDDGTAYLSWYPTGLQGWSEAVEPPAEWETACRGEVEPERSRKIASEALAAIDAWYPGIGRSEPLQVDAGAIVAIGRTDVNDASSGLHDRSGIGVDSHGGYHTINTGKLTTAPMFAIEAADRVEAFRNGRRVAS